MMTVGSTGDRDYQEQTSGSSWNGGKLVRNGLCWMQQSSQPQTSSFFCSFLLSSNVHLMVRFLLKFYLFFSSNVFRLSVISGSIRECRNNSAQSNNSYIFGYSVLCWINIIYFGLKNWTCHYVPLNFRTVFWFLLLPEWEYQSYIQTLTCKFDAFKFN